MKLVYKYFPSDRKAFFSNPQFRFTYPSDLNDPLECFPKLKINNIDELIKGTVERNREQLSKILSEDVLEKAIKKYTIDLKNNQQAFINRCLSIHMKHINKNVGILSLTKKNNIELLWSHYCEDHKGFVVGLNRESAFFNRRAVDRPDIGRLIDVIYEPNMLEVEIDEFKLPMEILYTKKDIWKDEQEIRIIRELKHADKKININEREIHLFNFPMEDIYEVIFGHKTNDTTISDILSFANSNKQNNIKFKKADYNSDGEFIIRDYI